MTTLLLLILAGGTPVVNTMEFSVDPADTSIYTTIRWPLIAGDSQAARRMNSTLEYSLFTGESIQETITNYREHHGGYTGAFFVVNHMDTDYLDISVTLFHLGPYPSEHRSSFLFNVDTGEQVTPAQLFQEQRMAELADICNGILQKNILEKLAEEPDLLSENMYQGHTFEMDHLENAEIRSEGIVFNYPFNFPHALLAAEPSGRIFLGWDELQGYLLPGVSRE